jgi:hypothetical protein
MSMTENSWFDLYNFDHALRVDQIESCFQQQLYQSGWLQPTPVTQQFSSAANVTYIKQQIEHNLQNMFPDPHQPIELVLNPEFVQVMIETVKKNARYLFDMQHGVSWLNYQIVEHETAITALSMRAQQRYYRQQLQNDRLKTMPRPLSEKTLYTKGENALTTSGWQLNHPAKGQYAQFLSQVLKIKPNSISP